MDVPDGATIIYWRFGMNLPFVVSADGLLAESGAGVSLLGRGIVLAKLADPIIERKVVSLPYSEALYLWSTGGRKLSGKHLRRALRHAQREPKSLPNLSAQCD